MLHMIELKYAEDQRDAARAYFQDHGFTHYNGDLVIKGLWVSTNERVAYAVVTASDAEVVDTACRDLQKFGEVEHRAVISADQL